MWICVPFFSQMISVKGIVLAGLLAISVYYYRQQSHHDTTNVSLNSTYDYIIGTSD